MQLNIYVPKCKEKLIQGVERLARKEHRSKNEVILAALDQYVKEHLTQEVEFGVYPLGAEPGARLEASSTANT